MASYIINNQTPVLSLLLWSYFRNCGTKTKFCNNRCSHHSYHLGNYRVLGALCHISPCGIMGMDEDKNIYYFVLL